MFKVGDLVHFSWQTHKDDKFAMVIIAIRALPGLPTIVKIMHFDKISCEYHIHDVFPRNIKLVEIND